MGTLRRRLRVESQNEGRSSTISTHALNVGNDGVPFVIHSGIGN